MEINHSGYECRECGLWGDVLGEYGTFCKREETNKDMPEKIRRELLEKFNKGVELRKHNLGEDFDLEEAVDFEDMGLTIIDKTLSCGDCKRIYDEGYIVGKILVLSSL